MDKPAKWGRFSLNFLRRNFILVLKRRWELISIYPKRRWLNLSSILKDFQKLLGESKKARFGSAHRKCLLAIFPNKMPKRDRKKDCPEHYNPVDRYWGTTGRTCFVNWNILSFTDASTPMLFFWNLLLHWVRFRWKCRFEKSKSKIIIRVNPINHQVVFSEQPSKWNRFLQLMIFTLRP